MVEIVWDNYDASHLDWIIYTSEAVSGRRAVGLSVKEVGSRRKGSWDDRSDWMGKPREECRRI